MGRWAWIVALLCACLVGTLVAVTVAPAGAVGTAAGEQVTAQQFDGGPSQAGEHERLQLRLRVQPDGDVVWTYRYVYPVDSDAERTAFRDYAERFESEETTLYRQFRNQSQALTSSASEHLGREMAAVDYRRSAGIDATPTREVGEVELTFRWTNFGIVEAGTVTVGDVFEGGFYLSDGQSLVFEAGDRLRFESVEPADAAAATPSPERQTATWIGEQQFADGHPRATVALANDSAPSANDDAAATDDGSTAASFGPSDGSMLVGGFLVLVVALLAVVAVRDEFQLGGFGGTDGGDATGTAEAVSTGQRSGGEPAAESPEHAPDHPATAEAASDEDRVEQLLEEQDGRMKQSAIVDETGWSKSKVSMLLSDMEDDGTISKIQVGRENIIALRGNEPEAASSPFDENE